MNKLKYFFVSVLILFSLILSNQVTDPKLPVSGVLYEKNTDGSSGSPLANVRIEFRNNSSGYNISVRTKSCGRYYALLPFAEYEMKVYHSNYIVRESGYSSNTKQNTKSRTSKGKKPDYPYRSFTRENTTEYNYNHSLPAQYPDEAPGAPEVQIEVSKTKVSINEPFYITVNASDDKGLAAIWWVAEVSTERSLLEPSKFDCDGETEVSWIWEVSVSVAGSIALKADAIDLEYSEEPSELIHKASDARRSQVVFVKVTEE
ncbi:MAG: carboxypeptidase regulatory-like domain-containing protein [Candidatus Marinimicrobia bacterium]|nr:carboxypeptidase regulatory-like domain-containing protein [Candidatus Neomarinimicrobiota bacterium]